VRAIEQIVKTGADGTKTVVGWKESVDPKKFARSSDAYRRHRRNRNETGAENRSGHATGASAPPVGASVFKGIGGKKVIKAPLPTSVVGHPVDSHGKRDEHQPDVIFGPTCKATVWALTR
jgi:hypothetical protein